MAPDLVYEYSHFATDGIDHHLFSELCSFRLINNSSALSRYQDFRDSLRKANALPKYIASVIHRSKLGVNIAIAAMIVIERFQASLDRTPETPFTEAMEDAGRLFLISYMVAAKSIIDEHHPPWFWKEVSDYQYTIYDLNCLELQFCGVLDWKVQITRSTFSESFIGMMDSYRTYLESHKLPSAPPPVYQRVQKHETVRRYGSFLRQAQIPITILSSGERVVSKFTGRPQRALQNVQWSKSFRMVWRKTTLSFA